MNDKMHFITLNGRFLKNESLGGGAWMKPENIKWTTDRDKAVAFITLRAAEKLARVVNANVILLGVRND